MDKLQSNIIILKVGGTTSGIKLRPLPPDFSGLWQRIAEDWNVYKTSIMTKMTIRGEAGKVTIPPTSNTPAAVEKKEFESVASNLIESSNALVTQLGEQVTRIHRT